MHLHLSFLTHYQENTEGPFRKKKKSCLNKFDNSFIINPTKFHKSILLMHMQVTF